MKDLIKKILKNKYSKLLKKNKELKQLNKEFLYELEQIKVFNIELQNKNYEISSNNEYLLKQINAYKKKNKELREKRK
jgi:hypothetical protein